MILEPLQRPVINSLFSSPLLPRSGGGPAYDPDAEALFARFTTPPTDERKGVINTLIVSLKTAGVWSKLDALYMLAAADAQAARRNWVQDTYNLSAVNSPAFTSDRGYAGNGSSSYLNTNFNPATAVGAKYVQNSAHLSAYDRTVRAANTAGIIGNDTSGAVGAGAIFPRFSGDLFYGRTNDGSGSYNVTNNVSEGGYITSRESATARALYKNGSQISQTSLASSPPTSLQFYVVGGVNLSGSLANQNTDQIAQASLGAGLSSSEASAFHAAIAAYLSAVGAI